MDARAPEWLLTDHLFAERVSLEHLDDLRGLLRDPRVARTLYRHGIPPDDEGLRLDLETKMNHWRRFGFGPWLLRDRSTLAFLGRGGLQHTFLRGRDEVEVGWAIVPSRWRQGLATELAQAALGVARDNLKLEEVVAFSLPDNHASRRVMEKTGFVFEGEILRAGLPHVLYRHHLGGRGVG